MEWVKLLDARLMLTVTLSPTVKLGVEMLLARGKVVSVRVPEAEQ